MKYIQTSIHGIHAKIYDSCSEFWEDLKSGIGIKK